MTREDFVAWLRDSILALPQSLKAALRIAEDPDLPDEARALMAGAVVHWLSRTNTIPGARGAVLVYVDDVLVLLFALDRVRKLAPESVERLASDLPDLFASFDADLALAHGYLGPGVKVLEQALDRVVRLKHMGRTAEQCVHDESAATMLYEELDSALVDFDLSPEAIARELKELDALIDELRKRGS